MSAKVKSYGPVTDPNGGNHGTTYVFHCPGCQYDHPFHVGGGWSFNGDLERPTFSPSLLCNRDHPASRCHSFVRDGRIEFLGDCWHALKGQTVELPDWEKEL